MSDLHPDELVSMRLTEYLDLDARAKRAEKAEAELKWFKDVIAEQLGYDGPAGNGCNPLRDRLAELARYKAALEYAKRHLYPAWETDHLARINEIIATMGQK